MIQAYPIPRRMRTSAQFSNFFPLTALIYEDLWRKRSLGILSRKPFSIQKEKDLLCEWLSEYQTGSILDLGCSTALYARTLAAEFPKAQVKALDFSLPMLREAEKRVLREGVSVELVRADAIALPFEDASFDALCMGGTLNELGPDTDQVLKECSRVLKPSGAFFVMYLLRADTSFGKGLQAMLKRGGLRFWSRNESSALFETCGFEEVRFFSQGVVAFSLLKRRG